MKNINPLHVIDFYKSGHIKFNPEGTQMIYTNFTPRSTKFLPKMDGYDDKIVAVGLQYYLMYFLGEVWNDGFFNLPKKQVLERFKRRMDTSLGVGNVGTEHIAALKDLNYLPISVKALPEGSLINAGIPYFTIRNTHNDFSWLTNYLEDSLSCLVWKTSTAATIVRRYRQIATRYAKSTGVDLNLVDYLLHDFSLRGCNGLQDALMVGGAFLMFQKGTDNVAAIDFLEQYYGANADNELIGCSVPANEHACVCAGGKENEFGNYKRWITQTFPSGIVSLVSDTWNLWNVVTNYLPRLKEDIMRRDGKVVIRPDSSPKTPLEIICGDKDAPIGSPENKGVIQLLWEIFGGTINSKGYRELDSHIGCIYGESIQPVLAQKIYQQLQNQGFAISNIFFGVGSYSFMASRDTVGYAAKATAAIVNGELRNIFKSPVTDSGTKKSAKGLLRVDLIDNEYVLKDQCTPEEELGGELREVFRDGKLLIEHKLSDIRERALKSI